MFTQANVSFSAPWGTGLIGHFNVSNDAQLLNNWTITFDVPFQIVNIWNATILTATSLGGGAMRYVVGSAGWNDTVPAGGAVSFGFEGRAEANIQAQLSGITFGTAETQATPPSVTISDATLMEGASGTREMVFTISLSKAATEAVTIPWSTQDGTALAGSDYGAASGSLTFAPGETSRTISVTILGDALVEGNESFNLVLGAPAGATIADGNGLGTIQNDDVLPSLSIADVQASEGPAGTKEMVFTVTLSEAAQAPVTLAYTTRDGTALAGSDYDAASGSLSFAVGETSKTITVALRGDAVDEIDESFEIALSGLTGASFARDSARGTILNDDAPPVLSVSNAEIVEGASGTRNIVFTLSLSQAIAQSVSVGFTTQDGTALAGSDYVARSGTVTFAAGQTSKTVSVAVRGDTAVELDESFNLVLSNVVRATLAPGGGTGTIRNDDLPPPTLSISDAQVSEGDAGTKQMLFTVSLSRAVTSTVAVTYATQDGTATAGSDFTAASGTLRFAAGEVSKTVAITVKGNTVVEADEAFSLVLGTATRATIADGTGLGTILNDDILPALSISDAQVTEGDNGTRQMVFTVSLSRAAASTVAVTYATQDGTATAGSDFTAASGTLRFAAGEVSKTIAVIVAGDTAVEADEALSLVLGTATRATIADGTGQGTILNDDIPPTLSISDAQLAEGNAGGAQMLFTVTLSRAAAGPVTIAYATQNGTATAGSDFQAANDTLTFAAGETSKTIAVTVNGDMAVEANESFDLRLSNATGATLADGTGVGTIVNDDVAAPTPSGDTASFRVTQSWNGGFLAEITIQNDATPIEGGWTLAFDAPFQIKGIWNAEIVSQSGSQYVIRNAPWNGDIAPLGATTFGIDVAGSGEPVNFSVNGAAPPPVLPGLSIGDAFLTEADSGSALMNFTVSLSAAASEAVVVQYGTADGSALAGLDYQALGGSLTFAPGEVSKILSVAVLGDTLREGNESFQVNLTAPSGARLLDASALGSIRDNDAPASTLPPPGWYSTSGNQIVDSTGETVRLKGVNWFGMEGYLGVPDGLYARNWQDMMEQMKEVGFDTIRLPFSLQNIQPGAMPNNIVYSLNPDLVGLSNLQVLDRIVDYAGDLGMKIILDCHRSSSGAGPNENGLWYDQNFSEAQWINSWKSLVQRYVDDSTVIGVDLQNEPHGATWTDWSAAAERAGNAIHEVNPNLLIVVEGVGNYQGDYYWWGGQLEGVRDDPVVLQQANKLVYSPHDYPNSIYPNSWFEGPNFKDNLPNVFREHWGFIYEEGIAPIFLGEFGTKLIDSRDIAWLDELTQYLNGDFDTNGVLDIADGQEGMSFAYWSWNPNSTDTGGILMDDWTSLQQAKLAALQTILIG
jgi:chitinase